jgi:hypothetical protein
MRQLATYASYRWWFTICQRTKPKESQVLLDNCEAQCHKYVVTRQERASSFLWTGALATWPTGNVFQRAAEAYAG